MKIYHVYFDQDGLTLLLKAFKERLDARDYAREYAIEEHPSTIMFDGSTVIGLYDGDLADEHNFSVFVEAIEVQ